MKEPDVLKGVVKFYDPKKGFGFITRAGFGDIYFNERGIRGDDYYPEEGDIVIFHQELSKNQHFRDKPIAVCVRLECAEDKPAAPSPEPIRYASRT